MSEQIKYIIPTPEGAYYLAHNNSDTWQKDVLKRLFSMPKSPQINNNTLQFIFDIKVLNNKDKLKFSKKINDFQKMKLIKIVNKEVTIPQKQLDQSLQDLFDDSLKDDKILIADSHGFCIANHGFPSEISEEISVLSADIAIMHKRRATKINELLGLDTQAWSLVDAFGNSRLGFWPLNINEEVFVLAIQGKPFLDKPVLVNLIWLLYLRFGKK